MASPLASTYGVWLVSLFLETILYGCGLLQTWLYFHWYSNDHWGIRTMIVLLLVFETLQVTWFFASTYMCLIDNFGNAPDLLLINWQVKYIYLANNVTDTATFFRMDSAQLLAGYLSALTVQLYFAFCIYVLDKKNKFPSVLIVILALTQIGAGIAQTTISTELGTFTKLDSTKPITTLQSAATLACDIVITVSLVRVLGNHKTGIKATNNMLNTLMINAINRGMLTALCAALNMILFLALPGTFYFFLGLMPSSKLYMNSALATLNTRQHVLKKGAYQTDHDWRSIPIGNLSGSNKTGTGASDDRVQITVDSETFYNNDDSTMGKKSTFISGMV